VPPSPLTRAPHEHAKNQHHPVQPPNPLSILADRADNGIAQNPKRSWVGGWGSLISRRSRFIAGIQCFFQPENPRAKAAIELLKLLLQDNTGYSSDEADRGYDRPGNGGGAQASGLGAKRAESGGAGFGQAGAEARLVDQICTPGGLRAQPSREDLRVFVESAGSLNGDTLAQLLEAKMVCPFLYLLHPQMKSIPRLPASLALALFQGTSGICVAG